MDSSFFPYRLLLRNPFSEDPPHFVPKSRTPWYFHSHFPGAFKSHCSSIQGLLSRRFTHNFIAMPNQAAKFCVISKILTVSSAINQVCGLRIGQSQGVFEELKGCLCGLVVFPSFGLLLRPQCDGFKRGERWSFF